jgi:protein-L-isoaspartate(D-aspartate) O-methyltransferase
MSGDDLQTARITMLRRQLRGRGIADEGVLSAMSKIPREQFVPAPWRDEAYADRALSIKCGQTISQPYIVALMTEALELTGAEKVLEVGTGSGYQTAILAELAREVYSIERISELSDNARETLDSLGCRNVHLRVADGTLGWPEEAPFDRIIVTAMAEHCPPALFEQICEGGIIVIPIGSPEYQNLHAIKKVSGGARTSILTGCRFVPLIGAQGWSEGYHSE